ncbi:MAG: MBL fold metallo-hydrolase, partial [Chloroflexi bacterium]|nr:MBL fold metallo-hydrolase [Chloroflexota bacterium]
TVYERPEQLDAIIVSHLHQDHFLDLFPLYYYLKYEARITKPVRVYAPTGAAERLGCLLGPGGASRLRDMLDIVDIEPGSIEIGDLKVAFAEVKHIKPTYGVVVTDGDRTLAYSSDTGYSETLLALANQASVFLCEATLTEAQTGIDHLTAGEAGRIAFEASAGKLVLTHVWPSLDPENSRLVAEEYFVGEVALAEDGEKLVI